VTVTGRAPDTHLRRQYPEFRIDPHPLPPELVRLGRAPRRSHLLPETCRIGQVSFDV